MDLIACIELELLSKFFLRSLSLTSLTEHVSNSGWNHNPAKLGRNGEISPLAWRLAIQLCAPENELACSALIDEYIASLLGMTEVYTNIVIEV